MSFEKTAESQFGSWSSPEARLTIEYPLELLDEIRLNVCSSFHTNPRGGVEAGGLLFGTRADNLVRIAAWRPISCEHSKGFTFILSERDMLDLARSMEDAKTDRDLKDLQIVGWFLSHTRSELGLTETDLGVFDQCFPLRWQFTLMLRPDGISATRAAFFVRNEDGKLCSHHAGQEFAVEPLHSTRPNGHASACSVRRTMDAIHPPAEAGKSDTSMVRIAKGPPASGPHERPRFARERRRKKNKLRWLWSIPIVAVLAAAALFVKERFFDEAPRSTNFALQLQDGPGGKVRIAWDKDARPIQTASRGALDIVDGGKSLTLPLDGQQLRRAFSTYVRRTGEVKVKLSVFQPNSSAPASEMAEFLGSPPADPAAETTQQAWEKEKSELQAEIKSLNAQLAREVSRNQQLLKLARMLQTRLDRLPPATK